MGTTALGRPVAESRPKAVRGEALAKRRSVISNAILWKRLARSCTARHVLALARQGVEDLERSPGQRHPVRAPTL
jgi:hypothetical protein